MNTQNNIIIDDTEIILDYDIFRCKYLLKYKVDGEEWKSIEVNSGDMCIGEYSPLLGRYALLVDETFLRALLNRIKQ